MPDETKPTPEAASLHAMQAEIDRRFAVAQRMGDMLTDQLKGLIAAERDHTDSTVARLEERLMGIDRATALLNESVNRVPTDLQQAVRNLNLVVDERFLSIAKQFDERDVRSERESRDNKVAVDAAFAAQKEAAAQTDVSNAKAIDKSETATNETIKAIAELNRTSSNAQSDKTDDLKVRMTTVEGIALGSRQSQGDRQAGVSGLTQVLSVVIAALILGVALYAALHK